MKVSSTEVQNNFSKYLKIASELEDVIVTRNGYEVA
jgi:prevent-host-death family protein